MLYIEFEINGVKLKLDKYELYYWFYKTGRGKLKNPYWKKKKLANCDGYLTTSINNKMFRFNRIVYFAHNPDWDMYDISRNNSIDHIDRDKLNNNISNLRVVNNRENNLNKDTLKKKVVVITRAKIRFSKLIQFWLSVPKASKAILKSKGVLFYKGIGELPFIHQATLSIWENQFDINQFAYSKKNHSDIIKKTRSNNWYREDMFTRFYLISDTNKTN